jgi:hypothetical protein
MILESFAKAKYVDYHRVDWEFQGFVFNNFHINFTLCIQHNGKRVYIQENLEHGNPYVLSCQQINTYKLCALAQNTFTLTVKLTIKCIQLFVTFHIMFQPLKPNTYI